MKDLLDTALVVVYNLTILGTTVFLISEKSWNPWWMVLAILLLASKKSKQE